MKEGESICLSLRQQNYQCLKQTRRLTWKISTPTHPPLAKEETHRSYLLTWLPAPVAVVAIIQTGTTLEDLWEVGLWIKQECEKFDYDKSILQYLRRVWAKHKEYLRNLQPQSDAIT